ncbi:MAG: ArsR/SmtB family transcription factor [Actinomycetes bacterium]
MTNESVVFAALGDPTRRAVLERLREGQRSVGQIAADLPVTQSAVSQHLRVLREAGLVSERREGARRLYRVDLDGLGELRGYVDGFWDAALASFRDFAEGERS